MKYVFLMAMACMFLSCEALSMEKSRSRAATIAIATPPAQPSSPTLRRFIDQGHQIAKEVGEKREKLENSANPVTRECCLCCGVATDACYIAFKSALIVGCCLRGLVPSKND